MLSGMLQKVFKIREKVAVNLGGPEDEEKPFLEHLEDLRTMLVRIAMTLVISVFATFAFNQWLTDTVQKPYVWAMNNVSEEIAAELAEDPNAYPADRPPFEWKMPGTVKPQEGFMASINVSLVAAVIVSFPLLLVFVLQFVMPGLRDNERKVLWPALGIGFGLFLTGVFFSYFSVLPRALEFFALWNYSKGFETIWMLGDYITFSTRFILIFGISFELPVVVMALVKLDFLSYKVMSQTRKHAIVAIAIFSAIITPTQDVMTLMLLAGPLYILYEICIWLARAIEKKERALYPEFYEEIDADQKALEEGSDDDWDNPDYNPWFGNDDDDDDDDDLTGGSGARPRAGTPPEKSESESDVTSAESSETKSEPASDSTADEATSTLPESKPEGTKTSDAASSESSDSDAPAPPTDKPDAEKTLEDFSKDDESKSGS